MVGTRKALGREGPTLGRNSLRGCVRFGERSMEDIVEEFSKLRQIGNVESYQKRFEELRSFMIQHNPHLSEAYFVSSY